jgi:hypothetical protein
LKYLISGLPSAFALDLGLEIVVGLGLDEQLFLSFTRHDLAALFL